MANTEHLKILKSGVRNWNIWRQSNPDIIPDLSNANLRRRALDSHIFSRANLYKADLSYASIVESDFNEANLIGADFSFSILPNTEFIEANLCDALMYYSTIFDADFSKANLAGVDFGHARIHSSNFSNASFTNADLSGAHVQNVNLNGANLSESDLRGIVFYDTQLEHTIFFNCILGGTCFSFTDLSTCIGLDSVNVSGSCSIDLDTLRKSKSLNELFLTKIGIPNSLIEYLPDFYNPTLMIYPAFLSHSITDKPFVRKLYEALIQKNVTIWLDEKKMKPGDNLHDSIAQGIKYYDKFIIVCSESSLKSWWVEMELERAYEKERQMQKERGKKFRLVIPIRIDDHIFSYHGGVFDTLKSSIIGDFTRWQDEAEFQKSLNLLFTALDANRPDIRPPSFL